MHVLGRVKESDPSIASEDVDVLTRLRHALTQRNCCTAAMSRSYWYDSVNIIPADGHYSSISILVQVRVFVLRTILWHVNVPHKLRLFLFLWYQSSINMILSSRNSFAWRRASTSNKKENIASARERAEHHCMGDATLCFAHVRLLSITTQYCGTFNAARSPIAIAWPITHRNRPHVQQ